MMNNETRITYKRVKNLGNYESETLEVSTSIADDVNLDIQIAVLREKVLSHLGIEETVEATEENIDNLLESNF